MASHRTVRASARRRRHPAGDSANVLAWTPRLGHPPRGLRQPGRRGRRRGPGESRDIRGSANDLTSNASHDVGSGPAARTSRPRHVGHDGEDLKIGRLGSARRDRGTARSERSSSLAVLSCGQGNDVIVAWTRRHGARPCTPRPRQTVPKSARLHARDRCPTPYLANGRDTPSFPLATPRPLPRGHGRVAVAGPVGGDELRSDALDEALELRRDDDVAGEAVALRRDEQARAAGLHAVERGEQARPAIQGRGS